MLSIISLLVVLTLSILVTRVATVALTHTGLSRASAKFQARSAFTGVGFTTNESEKVVNHPIRRRILMLLMLLGNAGIVTAVSSLIVSFVSTNKTDSLLWQLILLVSGLVILWSFASSKWVDRHLSKFITRILKRHTTISVQDFARLLHLAGDYQINELNVRRGDWIEGKSIAELGLRQEGIIVLGITRKDGNYLGAPDGDTQITENDVLILYGRAAAMKELDQRETGPAGDKEHRKMVKDQQKIQIEEKRSDPS
jgi:K+/H+ antiporter YhaU regulatory subunit KhtT